jgi:cytochrome c oxidase subunit 2
MTLQDRVCWITLAGIGGVALVFLYIISQATRPADANQVEVRAYAIRRWFFLVLMVLGVGVTAATLGAVSHSQPARPIAGSAGRQAGR